LRAWLREAQHLLDAHNTEGVSRSLARVRAQVELIEALLVRNKAEDAAREARQAADRAERAAVEGRRLAAEQERTRAILEQQEAVERVGTP